LENKKSRPGNIVLDSYSLLAYFGDEKGRIHVEKLFKDALRDKIFLYLTVVNLGEVVYITERERGLPSAQLVLSKVKELPISLVDVDENLALESAHIKARYPMAYADCFAVSLAIHKNAVLITGDPEFKKVQEEIDIFWL